MRVTGTSSVLFRALEVISPRIGIVNHILRAHGQTVDANIVAYSATAANPGAFTHGTVHLSGGAGVTWQDAFLATIGEALERYGSTFYRTDKLVRARARDLPPGRTIHPSRYALFADQQYERPGFRFVRFTEDIELYWDTATDLIDGIDKFVPATFIYMPYNADPQPISEQISTGFAAHTHPWQAVERAICEVIERDAFTIAWTNLLPLPRLRLKGELEDLAARLLPAHCELCLLDMTTDIAVPGTVGLLKGKLDFGEFIAVCAASRPYMDEAVRKTLIELCQAIPYFRALLAEEHDYSDFNNVRKFVDHSLFYLYRKDLWHVFEPWFATEPTEEVPIPSQRETDPRKRVKMLVSALKQHSYNVLVKDKTLSDVQDDGFYLVRAVCPELIHLNGTYGEYYLGGKRLYETPRKMGYDISNTYETLNHLPHPFP